MRGLFSPNIQSTIRCDSFFFRRLAWSQYPETWLSTPSHTSISRVSARVMAGVHPARAYRFARPMHPYSDSPSGVQLARAGHSSGNDSHSPASVPSCSATRSVLPRIIVRQNGSIADSWTVYLLWRFFRKNGDGLRRHPFCPEAVVCPHPSLHQNIEYGQIELLWSWFFWVSATIYIYVKNACR